MNFKTFSRLGLIGLLICGSANAQIFLQAGVRGFLVSTTFIHTQKEKPLSNPTGFEASNEDDYNMGCGYITQLKKYAVSEEGQSYWLELDSSKYDDGQHPSSGVVKNQSLIESIKRAIDHQQMVCLGTQFDGQESYISYLKLVQ